MLMEALFSRGGYPIHHRINGFSYTFRRNDDGHFVCPVLSGEHRKMMADSGNFRTYEPSVKATVHQDVPLIATRPIEPMEGSVDDLDDASPAGTDTVKPRRGGRRKKA